MAGAPDEITVTYRPYGGAKQILECRDPQVLIEGPAGSGKTLASCYKLHLVLLKYPGTRAIMLRKSHSALKNTALVTFTEKVLHPLDGVRFYGGSAKEPPNFRYPNGSRLMVGGLDKSEKVLSAEYDLAYINEATEVTENDWETVTTRLRNGKMPYQQIIGDCNPQWPTHWLNERCNSGRMTRLLSRHEDNPTITHAYLDALRSLSGVRRARLYLGLWAAAEGIVYEESWDANANIVDRQTVSTRPADLYGDCGIPQAWPRYLAVDFGYNHPFVCQWYAEDPDGRLYRYREMYKTKTLVEDHAKEIRRYSKWGAKDGDPFPRAIICDHDAEDRATLERHLNLVTTPAVKAVSEGIQSVSERMRKAGDGKPRLLFLRDSLVERDQGLIDKKQPTCYEEEIDGYLWDLRAGAKKGELPVKESDHAQDACRYVVAWLSRGNNTVTLGGAFNW